MKPVDMISKHDPDNGTFGDCLRCCVASILDLPAETVPHFMYDGDGDACNDRLSEFLSPLGLVNFTLSCNDYMTEEFRRWPSVYHVLSGPSPRYEGFYHAVVALNGEIVHDPHPSRGGILPPTDDRPWVVDLFVSRLMGNKNWSVEV